MRPEALWSKAEDGRMERKGGLQGEEVSGMDGGEVGEASAQVLGMKGQRQDSTRGGVSRGGSGARTQGPGATRVLGLCIFLSYSSEMLQLTS